MEFPSKSTAAVDTGFVSLHGMTGVVSFSQFTATLRIRFSVRFSSCTAMVTTDSSHVFTISIKNN